MDAVARVTRQTAKAMTRERLISEAKRLFRERGYAATSLEQIAEAAEVTKGAIYGHFSSKEDLLLSALEATPTRNWAAELNGQSGTVRERLAGFGRAMAADQDFTDQARLAAELVQHAAEPAFGDNGVGVDIGDQVPGGALEAGAAGLDEAFFGLVDHDHVGKRCGERATMISAAQSVRRISAMMALSVRARWRSSL
jgi:AcrR family transcriptional regulator